MCVFVVFCLFFKNLLLSARRMRFSKIKMDQFLTLKRANIGPIFNFTTYIYIYVFICVCLSLSLFFSSSLSDFDSDFDSDSPSLLLSILSVLLHCPGHGHMGEQVAVGTLLAGWDSPHGPRHPPKEHLESSLEFPSLAIQPIICKSAGGPRGEYSSKSAFGHLAWNAQERSPRSFFWELW